jgi:hypothetical protein
VATATKEKAATKTADKPKRTVKSGMDRRPRGWLENDCFLLCEKFVDGSLTLPEKEGKDGKPVKQLLTPHRLAKLVQTTDALDEPPSTGAVAAVFTRWKSLGFANFNEKPFAFKGFTAGGKSKGLEAMKAEKREALFAQKRADREANPKPKKEAAPKKETAKAAKAPTAKKSSAPKQPKAKAEA